MKTENKPVVGKIIAGAVAGLLVGGLGVGAYMSANPVTKEVVVEKNVTIEVPKEVTVEKTITVEKEVPVEVEKIVEVDNGNLGLVMDFVNDNVDEDVSMDYIVFEVDARMESEDYLNSNLIDIIKDADYFEDGEALEDYRVSEVSIKKISDAEIVSRDFEDKDLELEYTVRVKAQEDGDVDSKQYFDFKVVVPFESGVMQSEDIEVELLE